MERAEAAFRKRDPEFKRIVTTLQQFASTHPDYGEILHATAVCFPISPERARPLRQTGSGRAAAGSHSEPAGQVIAAAAGADFGLTDVTSLQR